MPKRKPEYVYVVYKSTIFHNFLDTVCDTHEAAEAYIQSIIDMEKRKHMRGHGGRWLDKTVHAEAMVTCGNGDYYMLSIEKSKVHTKEDIKDYRAE